MTSPENKAVYNTLKMEQEQTQAKDYFYKFDDNCIHSFAITDAL